MAEIVTIRETSNTCKTLGFLGDFVLTETEAAVFTLDERLSEILKACDFMTVNLEGPITEKPFINKPGIRLKNSPEVVGLLKAMNVKAVNLGNNHIMDCGEEGLLETIDYLDKNEIKFFGAGRNLEEASGALMLNLDNIDIALSGFSHDEGIMADIDRAGPAPVRTESLESAKAVSKNGKRLKVLCYHGGEEFLQIPWPDRRDNFLRWSELGTDIIIGHHAHVYQGWEIYNGRVIFYGLGNFYMNTGVHFNHRGTDIGLLALLKCDREGVTEVTNYLIKADREKANLSLVDENDEEYLHFKELSRILALTEREYLQAWREDCFGLLAGKNNSRNPRLPGFPGRFLRFFNNTYHHHKLYRKNGLKRDRDILSAAFQGMVKSSGFRWLMTGRREI